MNDAEATEKLAGFQKQISDIRSQMREVQASIAPEDVSDYEFQTTDGPVRLSDLFGDKEHLFVIHNMGKSCPYCTLWADGFNSVYHHLNNRAAFVLSSPDDPQTQKDFARSRDWVFPIVSHGGTNFADDMGYKQPDMGWQPGVSVFKKDGDTILRLSDTSFGPNDDFCIVWHFFNLIPEGPDGWAPKYSYD